MTSPPLKLSHVALVACLPAITEELLFRGALVGNLGGSASAATVVALLFGFLHITGPRNYASGVFATAAGFVYGILYITTASVWIAAVAHAVGNVTSAALWKVTQPFEPVADVMHLDSASDDDFL
jgi:uncharacterized protein